MAVSPLTWATQATPCTSELSATLQVTVVTSISIDIPTEMKCVGIFPPNYQSKTCLDSKRQQGKSAGGMSERIQHDQEVLLSPGTGRLGHSSEDEPRMPAVSE